MNASNLLKAVLRPRALSSASRQRPISDGGRERRSLSPDNRLPSPALVAKKAQAASPVKKMTCMCSPTNHPGSFRCRYHRELAAKAVVVALPSTPRGRSPAPTAPSVNPKAELQKSVVFSEVNRTLPGRPSRTARSPTGRTSRLQFMTLSTGFEEEDEFICSAANDVLRTPKTPSSIRSLSSSEGTRPAATSYKGELPKEIPTMFCQSTSRVATDVFTRSMSRMYL